MRATGAAPAADGLLRGGGPHLYDEARKFYDLERLWSDAEEIPLEKPQAAQ